MNNNEHCHSNFGHVGPHATFHHQHFQMVNLMMMYCERTMNRLNPHALLCEPEVSDNKAKEENEALSKGEKADKQQSRVNKLMTSYDFGWKIPSMHERMNNKKHSHIIFKNKR